MTREDYEEGVQHARLALEIAAALATDLVKKGNRLEPATRSRLVDALRNYEDQSFSPVPGVNRLREALKAPATPLEREDKRERPR